MSRIKIRLIAEADCFCGYDPRIRAIVTAGTGATWRCRHDGHDEYREYLECDLGEFRNSGADPCEPGGLDQLMLVRPDVVERILKNGPEQGIHGDRSYTVSVTHDAGHTYWHVDHQGQRTTWELHDGEFPEGFQVPAVDENGAVIWEDGTQIWDGRGGYTSHPKASDDPADYAILVGVMTS